MSDTGLTVGDITKALTERSEISWRVQDMIDGIRKSPRAGWDVAKLCMEVEVRLGNPYSDSQGKELIVSEEERASVDAIYATKGEPIEMLRSDQADIWQPLVTALQDRRRK